MTESPDATEAEAFPAPAPAVETPAEKTPKETKEKKEAGFPVGQAAVGGLGAVTLGSYALASVVGPVGWLAAPAAAGVAGVGYVAYRHSKKRGKRGGRRRSERRSRTIRRAPGGRLRMGSPSLPGGRGRASSPSAARAGGVGAPGRGRSGGLGGSSALKGAGAKPGASGRGASPRGAAPRGGGLRGSSPRSSSPRGGSAPRGGGLFGRRSPGATSSKRKTTPPTGGTRGKGTSPRTFGGSMSKTRWGGSSGPTAKPAGRLKRAGRAAGAWADRKTGQKASTAFKAARGQKGFRARSKAASKAVRKKGGGKLTSGIVGVIVAAWAGLASLFGGSKKKTPTGKHAADTAAPSDTPAARYARDGYKLGPEVPGAPGSFYADPTDTRPGYVDPRGGAAWPGYTTTEYDANVDPRTWEQRVAARDVPGFSPKPTTPSPGRPVTHDTGRYDTSQVTTTGGTTMARMPATQMAHDMSNAMSRYEPADAWGALQDAKEWPEVFSQVGFSLKNYTARLEGARFPFHPAIGDKMRDVFQALGKVYDLAEEIEPLIRKVHADDIAKKEAPRGDESKWNV